MRIPFPFPPSWTWKCQLSTGFHSTDEFMLWIGSPSKYNVGNMPGWKNSVWSEHTFPNLEWKGKAFWGRFLVPYLAEIRRSIRKVIKQKRLTYGREIAPFIGTTVRAYAEHWHHCLGSGMDHFIWTGQKRNIAAPDLNRGEKSWAEGFSASSKLRYTDLLQSMEGDRFLATESYTSFMENTEKAPVKASGPRCIETFTPPKAVRT